MALARAVSALLTALIVVAAPAAAFAQAATPASTLFPLDHFWTHQLDSPFAAAPAVDDRRVYVPLETGQLVAFEPGRAEPVWSVELPADGPPLAAGGKLFVPATGAIHALDAATGAVVWRLPAGALAAPLTHRTGWLIVALADGALQAVRAGDGAVVWARAMSAPLAAAPSIDGNLLAAALTDGRLAVIDIATGKSIWEKTLGSRPGGLTLSGDRIFVSTDNGFFWSIKTRDGDLDWRYRLGTRLVGAAAADADRIYAVALDNIVRGFTRGSGHISWSAALPTRALAGPEIIDGIVVITTGDVGEPGLTYIDAKRGAAVGQTPALPGIEETMRAQYPAVIVPGASFAVIVTANVSGDWQLHAYRQTFLTAATGPVAFGKLYEVRLRLEITAGHPIWGTRVTPAPPPGWVPTGAAAAK